MRSSTCAKASTSSPSACARGAARSRGVASSRSAAVRNAGSSSVRRASNDAFMDIASTSGGANDDGKRVTLRDVLGRDTGGPPRIFCPVIEGEEHVASSKADATSKPLAVYLPGLDGTGFSASSQFAYLSKEFDLVALNIPASDRSDVFELVRVVCEYLEAHIASRRSDGETTDVFLVGESMGGLLALCVACERPDLITRLILVNPASSFDKSVWPVLGPALPSVPEELWSAVPYALTPVLIDPVRMATGVVEKFASDANASGDPVNTAVESVRELAALLPALGALAEIIPRDALAHRLDKVLRAGCEYLNEDDYRRLTSIRVPTLVVASENDQLIPSLEESERLRKFLPNCKVEVVRDASHALLQEPKTNLMEIARRNGFAPRRQSDDIMTRDAKFEPPSVADIEKARASLSGLRALTSPVFFSTRPDGKVVSGLRAVPIRQRGNRPILLVGNHQTMAPDLGFLVDEFLREYNVCVRGLAHPVVSRVGAGVDEDQTSPPSRAFEDALRDAVKGTPIESMLPRREPVPPRRAMAMGGLGDFTTFGAVPVSGMNFYRLMKQGEAVLLFPGGVREAFKRRNEKYELFWPTQPEFVRMAIKHDAIIVPFAAVGAEDSFDIVADARDLLNNPLFGANVRERATKMPRARAVDTRFTDGEEGDEELFIQPVLAPKTPERFYFRFMEPIDLRQRSVAIDDDDAVAQIYSECKSACQDGIEYLRSKRNDDPFASLPARLLYERASSSQAPTFTP